MDFSKRQYLQTESENSLQTRVFNEKNIIFRKGESGDCMYEVLSGSVGIYIHYGEANQLLLAEKPAGTFFGEIALIENRPRTATAVALEEMTKLREISANGFIYYIRRNPDSLKIIMDAMSERFKEMRREYFEVCKTLAEYRNAIENFDMITGDLEFRINNYVLEAKKQEEKEAKESK